MRSAANTSGARGCSSRGASAMQRRGAAVAPLSATRSAVVLRPLGPGKSPSPPLSDLRPALQQQPVDAVVLEPPTSSSGSRRATPVTITTSLAPSSDFKWAQDDYNAVQRTIDTWTFFTVFRAGLWLLEQKWSYPGGFSEAKKVERRRGLARYLLQSVLELGPTFIKLGQLGSTRSDLFPVEFCDELSKLQDRVPSFSAEKAMAIIEADLGRPVEQMFQSFDPVPIAAASLGQVHRAVLLSGEQVVVKVQRPGLKQLFDIDLANLRLLAEQLDKGDDNRDFKGIYQECAQTLYEEIDYINEARNCARFKRNFRTTPWVRVPTVHWEYVSPRVLTMEFLPGTKVSNRQELAAAGIDPNLIARRATESYLQQILIHGFFHADPHPGNISVDTRGNLVVYDFGMMGEIVPDVRSRLTDLFVAIYQKDTAGVIDVLVALKVIKLTGGDTLAIRRAVGFFLTNLANKTQQQDAVSAIGEDLFTLAVDSPFRFPATFTFVLRAFSTLEGIGRSLNPDYRFADVATPYAQQLLSASISQESRQGPPVLWQQATEVGAAAAAMPLRVQRIDNVLTSLEAGDLKLRARVLEGERAARRSSVMQAATVHVVGALGFVNLGTTLALSDHTGPAAAALAAAGVFAASALLLFRRVNNLDKFEKQIKG